MPSHDQNRDKRSFFLFFDLGLLISSSHLAVFWGWAIWSRGRELRNASFLRVSRLVAFLGRLIWCPKNWPSKVCEKASRQKNGAIFLCHVLDHFWVHRFSGWVFLRCGARFWAPLTRGKCHFRTPWSGPRIATFAFFDAFPLRCRAFWG